MSVSPEDLQLPIDVAEEELKALSQESRGLLLEWLDAVFLHWKGQQGQQPVIGVLATSGLLTTEPPPPDGPPWRCAGPFVWNAIDLFLKLWGEAYSPLQQKPERQPEYFPTMLAVLILNNAQAVNSVR